MLRKGTNQNQNAWKCINVNENMEKSILYFNIILLITNSQPITLGRKQKQTVEI